mmetsp:Transcript_21177/g.27879  ORF Transcript_21177/g.27879 Transcript_21177/m.27879 type:complete len:104 (-) Transcript_21177:44-355(-)
MQCTTFGMYVRWNVAKGIRLEDNISTIRKEYFGVWKVLRRPVPIHIKSECGEGSVDANIVRDLMGSGVVEKVLHLTIGAAVLFEAVSSEVVEDEVLLLCEVVL